MSSQLSPSSRLRWQITAAIVGLGAVFATDLLAPHGYGFAFAYLLIVLAVALTRRALLVIWSASLGIALTVVGYVVHQADATALDSSAAAFNRVFASVLIGLTAVLVSRYLVREREHLELGRSLKSAELDRETERRMLAAASEITAIGTWSINSEDNRFDLSDVAARMHGQLPGDRPTLEDVLGLMPPDDALRVRQSLDVAWTTGAPFREEVRITLPDGSERWIVSLGESLGGGDDEVAQLHGTVQDITQWKQAEMSATSQHNRFFQLASSLPILVWTATADGMMDYLNAQVMSYTGYTEDHLLADQWVSVVDPRDLDRVGAAWAHSLSTGEKYEIEFRIRGADGVYRWHQVAALAERDEAGAITRWWGSSVNIHTAVTLRETADALAAEREVVLNSMTDGVFVLDVDWRIVYVNGSAERIFERGWDELLGIVFWDLYPTEEELPVRGVVRQAMERGTSERLTYHSEALNKWLEMSATRSPAGVSVFFRDITDVTDLSEQLAQARRLETVGQLTGGIAHDFNNLLTVVLGGADALSDDDTISSDGREMAAMIATAAERGAELTHRLLAFARRQPLEPVSVDLAESLRKVEPLLRRTLGEHISMEVLPSRGQTLAEVDPGQYDNAVLNLAINARDAMPEGGSLTIEVEPVTLDETYITAHAELLPGNYVVTTVSDSGDGIPPEDIDRLFDPFFTTKEIGQGSGLGLAMVWGFVKQSGGHITVYTEPGIGSSFKLYLPSATAAVVPVNRVESSPAAAGNATGTVLMAEDDDLVRSFATDRLRSQGYKVVEAGSGPEALEALSTMDHVDLLFTDVIMPGGMTGRDLADAVTAQRPGTPVLYASGYTENVIIHNGRLDVGVKLLAKPYSARQLVQRVGELIMPARSEGS